MKSSEAEFDFRTTDSPISVTQVDRGELVSRAPGLIIHGFSREGMSAGLLTMEDSEDHMRIACSVGDEFVISHPIEGDRGEELGFVKYGMKLTDEGWLTDGPR